MSEHHPERVSDERLIEILRNAETTPALSPAEQVDLADEMIRRRRASRRDSKRSDEIKRLRWTVEATLKKIETIEQLDRADDTLRAEEIVVRAELAQLRKLRNQARSWLVSSCGRLPECMEADYDDHHDAECARSLEEAEFWRVLEEASSTISALGRKEISDG